ncbi:MAG: L-fucose:H+ symporter permease [Bacteroidetes bacterium]|nr:L-fucose:H+ symporter permease [Bacteroidota bacterium]
MRYIYSLFFLWAIAHNLNPLLIPHLKKVCELSDLQSALVDSAFYIGYFVMALPAGAYIKRFGYTKAITVGLMLFGVGALMVGAFGSQQQFYAALAGLFTMAAGLTFLETAANPLVTLLGKPETATTRLNLAQSFNGLGAVISVFIGGMILFPNSTTDVASNAIAVTPNEITDALSIQAEKLLKPYFFIAIITVSLGRAFWRGWIKLPEIPSSPNTETQDNPKTNNFLNPTEPYLQPNLNLVQQIRSLLAAPNYNLGLLAQFCYVGAQVGVGSFFIRYATTHSHVQESVAATALSLGLLLFMTGRFLGTFLMRFIAAAKLLSIYASICIVLCLFVSLYASAAGMWILILLQFFMSIMFPSIFSLSLGQLKQSPPMASSLLIMSIVGGAFFPLCMGFLSDQTSIQYAYLVPALCFVAVAIFAKRISALASFATSL